jgi:hypothetical protein
MELKDNSDSNGAERLSHISIPLLIESTDFLEAKRKRIEMMQE